MSKTADKASESAKSVDLPTFDPSKAADQGADDTQKALKSILETANSVGNELSLKTIAALRANAEADFAHLEALVGAKSLPEVFELQTTFLRKRLEMSVEQTTEFQELTTKAMADVTKPVNDAFEKSLNDLRIA